MTRIWIGAVAGLTLLAACMETAMPDHTDGHALYMQYCASCHGGSGTGDGPYARDLANPPKNLTLIQARHGTTFPRAEVMSIVDGYTRLDDDRPGMPEFGDLLEGELVPFDSGDGVQTPTPWKLVALVEYLKSIQQTR